MNMNSLKANEEKKLYEQMKEFNFFAEDLSNYIQSSLNGEVSGSNMLYCISNVEAILEELKVIAKKMN